MKKLVLASLILLVNCTFLLSFNFHFFYESSNYNQLKNFSVSTLEDYEMKRSLNINPNNSGVELKYDKNGNRIARNIIVLKSSTAALDSSITIPPVFESINEDNSIVIYPNPTKRELKVVIGKIIKNSSESFIYSLSGNLLFQQSIYEGSNLLNLSNLSSGVYILRLNIDGQINEWKLVKE